jgi:hypothetical protein
MITYNLLIKLQEGSKENVDKARTVLLGMQEKIEYIRDLKVEVDIRRAETSYDIALIAKFDTMADYEAYLPHPVHMEVGNQLKNMLKAAAAVCYED